MKDHLSKEQSPIILDFNKVWRFLPLSRPKKEMMKYMLFTGFPFIFSRFAVFMNWKSAQIFKDKSLSVWSLEFWQRCFSKSYLIRIHNRNEVAKNTNQGLAIAIHAFYADIFADILGRLEKSGYHKIALYVTTTASQFKIIEGMLNKSSYPFILKEVENHGRDILPFLKMLPLIFADGNELILKIHTKKSNHLNRKELWRNDLLNKLIGVGAINKAISILENNDAIGIIGPANHILPMYYYYGGNALRVIGLGKKMGVDDCSLNSLNFVAGSMFYAKKEALLPILNLGLNDSDFEIENLQVDGTMAHAVERAFAVALLAANLQLSDTDYDSSNPVLTVSTNHHFTI